MQVSSVRLDVYEKNHHHYYRNKLEAVSAVTSQKTILKS